MYYCENCSEKTLWPPQGSKDHMLRIPSIENSEDSKSDRLEFITSLQGNLSKSQLPHF